MSYRLTQVTAPTGNILTRDEVKDWLSESSEHSDDIIDDILMVVHTMLDGEHSVINSTVLPTTWQMSFWSFPDNGGTIKLPLPPIISINSFEYDNNRGTTTDVGKVYRYREYGHELLGSWDAWPTDIRNEPSVEPIRIEYRAGYDTATPAPIRQCALALCSHLFDNRTQYQGGAMTANSLDPAIRNILASYDLR